MLNIEAACAQRMSMVYRQGVKPSSATSSLKRDNASGTPVSLPKRCFAAISQALAALTSTWFARSALASQSDSSYGDLRAQSCGQAFSDVQQTVCADPA